jgi:hypothetical protein
MSFLPEIPVRFVYLGADGRENLNTEFDTICVSVPHVGELIVPDAGSRKVEGGGAQRLSSLCAKRGHGRGSPDPVHHRCTDRRVAQHAFPLEIDIEGSLAG